MLVAACVFLFNSEATEPSWTTQWQQKRVGADGRASQRKDREKVRERSAPWLACSCGASALWRSGKQANYRALPQRRRPCHLNLPVRISWITSSAVGGLPYSLSATPAGDRGGSRHVKVRPQRDRIRIKVPSKHHPVRAASTWVHKQNSAGLQDRPTPRPSKSCIWKVSSVGLQT